MSHCSACHFDASRAAVCTLSQPRCALQWSYQSQRRAIHNARTQPQPEIAPLFLSHVCDWTALPQYIVLISVSAERRPLHA